MAGLFQDFDPLLLNKNVSNNITRGSLISFNYPISQAFPPNVIHDSRPMVIVADVFPGYLRGVNLHYLTFPYIKKLLQTFSGNASFSYASVRPDRYIANAFRVYASRGISQTRKLDTTWLLNLLASIRSFNPAEIEKINSTVQQQIQSRLQMKARDLAVQNQVPEVI